MINPKDQMTVSTDCVIEWWSEWSLYQTITKSLSNADQSSNPFNSLGDLQYFHNWMKLGFFKLAKKKKSVSF